MEHRQLGSSPPAQLRSFRVYAASRVAAWVGHAASAVALPVMIFELTDSARLTGLLAAAESLPYLLLGMHVGALVDRWNGKRVMVSAALVTALSLATVPVASAVGVLTAHQLLAVALAGGVSFVFLDAAAFGTLPRIVGVDRIGAATAVLSVSGTVVGIAVPALVGLVLPVTGGPAIVAADAVLCAASAVLLAGVRLADPERLAGPRTWTVLADIREGLAFIWRHPVIRPLTLLGFGNAFTGGAVTGLIVVVGVRHLGFTQDDGRIGWVYAASAVGALAGATVLPRLQAKVGVGLISQVGYGAMTVIVLAWATTSNWLVAVGLLCLEGMVGTAVILNGIVARQTLTPMRLQGRVNTTARVIAWGGAPLGAAVGGSLAETWDVGLALYLCSAGVALAFAAGLWWRLPSVGLLECGRSAVGG